MTVTGEGPSISVRLMREPVTVTLSRVAVLLAVGRFSEVSSWASWANKAPADGMANAAKIAAHRRLLLGSELLTGICESPKLTVDEMRPSRLVRQSFAAKALVLKADVNTRLTCSPYHP